MFFYISVKQILTSGVKVDGRFVWSSNWAHSIDYTHFTPVIAAFVAVEVTPKCAYLNSQTEYVWSMKDCDTVADAVVCEASVMGNTCTKTQKYIVKTSNSEREIKETLLKVCYRGIIIKKPVKLDSFKNCCGYRNTHEGFDIYRYLRYILIMV